jgi:SAM-dependent methyltransferase
MCGVNGACPNPSAASGSSAMTTALTVREYVPLPCVVCGSSQATQRYQVRDLIQARDALYWFATCDACGHGYLSPYPTDEELGELYRSLWSPEGLQLANNVGNSGFEKGLTADRLEGLRAVLGDHPVRRLLDVGCGLGFYLRAMAEAWPDAQAQGVELVDAAASRAERPGVEVLRQPWDKVELPSGEFDIVSLIHFLEHQTDPGADIERAAALLRPGGALVVEVPRLDGWGRRMFGRWYWPHLPPQHLQVFSTKGLTRLLEDRGLEVGFTRSRKGYPLQACTTLVLFARFTFGSRSHHKDNWLIRLPLMLLGLSILPYFFLWDLIAAPILNRMGMGDILLLIARKKGAS